MLFRNSKKITLILIGHFVGKDVYRCERIISSFYLANTDNLKSYLEPYLCLKHRPNDRNISTQHIATLLGTTCCVRLATMLRHVGCCSLEFDHFQTFAKNTRHVATGWPKARNMLRSTMLRYVALTCCDRLGGGFKQSTSTSHLRLEIFV